MNELIETKLQEIEAHCNVRVLLAVESGSRAWGFASPDSDYDVRFVYARDPVDYLRLTKVPDVIDTNYVYTLDEEAQRQAYPNTLPTSTFNKWSDPLDFSGWDLQKFLVNARDCGASSYEWVHSPIVYRTDARFHNELIGVMHTHYRPRKAFFHYLNLGLKTLQQARDLGTVKQTLYAFRSLLVAHFIYRFRRPAPVPLQDLVDALKLHSAGEYQQIGKMYATLLEQKTSEKVRIDLVAAQWEILDNLWVTGKEFGDASGAWRAEESPDIQSDNSSLLAYSRFLQRQYLQWPK